MVAVASTNEFVVKFANVNGTGSASANHLFAKALFRMGIPVSPRNLFPSNIQGLPTWYEVRISEQGYLGRRSDRVELVVAMNPQSFTADVDSLVPGGYLLYDSTKLIDLSRYRDDIHWLGIPLMDICMREYQDPRQRQIFKNIIYVGALAALLNIEFPVVKDLIADQFRGKEKLIAPNIHALELGHQYASQNFDCPLGIQVRRRDLLGDAILVDGNTAAALGCVYGGATVASWYPITPSTSLVEAFEKYANRLRIDPGSGNKNFAILQAEDEISAMGIVIGASWNGARAFTATSGPGVSLMTEFLGLAYYAEIPVVLFNVQRGGPSTGMPTRTQQADLLSSAYASHGDTKHILLFPADPRDSFELAAQAFDLAERLQTPVIVMLDLELGMNDWVSPPFDWDDRRRYDRGKVLDAGQLQALDTFGRYVDVDGDGIPYRTYPGTHPDKGAFFTRGTSHNPFAGYSESNTDYVENVDRITRKFTTACDVLPAPVVGKSKRSSSLHGVVYIGTTALVMNEVIDRLGELGVSLDTLQVRAFPFHAEVFKFIKNHQKVFVIDQNRDGQLRTLLINEGDIDPAKLVSILHYDGHPITAATVIDAVVGHLDVKTGRPSPAVQVPPQEVEQ
ncbi:2-oxoacid:acceptor oxidoreductase subunit alpha [Exilibacterium tricleocarpae]|uniref:2-oxoacid:acceptor oxidoreductase subunit alpha n=1 Tax=Exilibacterium tricleocarpae TaxID=2591008 RepID=A0A545TS23_9GAMM|nr:2-oxoacid:acceptor oxidoreductase subunit alpha [Exilibacterium tricleocarpae]TQV80027.1 2-oxoacid:acceptor oxidoreductase subunit alpha [Exilibacterium tricleocarpae]